MHTLYLWDHGASNEQKNPLWSCLPLRRFDFSRKAGEAGEQEARDTGDEHARDHHPLSPFRAHHFSQRERRLVTRKSLEGSTTGSLSRLTNGKIEDHGPLI